MNFSIIICTYNRSEVISHCLESIVDFGGKYEYEVIVVDNGAGDSTKKIVEQFITRIDKLRYVRELKVGLSYARNKGALEAKTDWLFYLDDDAKLTPTTLLEFHNLINNYNFKLFTGVYHAWYLTPPPKWLKDHMVSYRCKGGVGIRKIEEDHVCGGVMGIHKPLLIKLGMFDPRLGMKGSTIGYGEESELQFKALKEGIDVGINTNLKIDHLVGLHKYKPKWFLRSAFQKGKDAYYINKTSGKYSWNNIIASFLERIIKNLLRTSYKFVFQKNYLFTNWYIDNISPICGFYGIIKSKLQSSNQNNT
ncbi:MAG: glycosyltransferase family 2 protein [Saprospiraceae bacterium]|nr:glycosyltransferase family 2 protein [Saprospiraceae bacterium]